MVLSGSGPAYQRSEPVAGSRSASPYVRPADRREAALSQEVLAEAERHRHVEPPLQARWEREDIRHHGLEPGAEGGEELRRLIEREARAVQQRHRSPAARVEQPVEAATRAELVAHLDRRRVESGIVYPRAVYDYPCYRNHPGVVQEACPRAEALAGEVLSLPVRPGLTRLDLGRIVDAVAEMLSPRSFRLQPLDRTGASSVVTRVSSASRS